MIIVNELIGMKVPGMAGSFHQRTIKDPKTGNIKGKYWYYYTYDPSTKKMKSERRDPPTGERPQELSKVVNELTMTPLPEPIQEGAKLLFALFETVSQDPIPEFEDQLRTWVEQDPTRLDTIKKLQEALQ